MNKLLIGTILAILFVQSLAAQVKHGIGLSIFQNKFQIEHYSLKDGVKGELRQTERLILYAPAVNYSLEYKMSLFFLSTGVDFSYNNVPPSIIDHYYSIGLPLIGGIEYSRYIAFIGVVSSFSTYNFAKLNGTQLNKELCLCELNKYQESLIAGLGLNFTKNISLKLALNLYPANNLLFEGLSKKTRVRIIRFNIFYKI